jgi:chorismate dehydratase
LVSLQAKLNELNKRIRVGAVSYLNTKPFLYGIKRSGLIDSIDLIEEYPARLTKMLLNDEIDVGLVPVITIPLLPESHIITQYCIGTEGEVASVALFSEVPLSEITTVLLDYQSRTSVNLARVLLKEYWQKEVIIENATTDYISKIKGTTAGVVIGDRALEQRLISPYIYDLGAAWKAYTALPFVFAAWVANKSLGNSFEEEFNSANQLGLQLINEVVADTYYPAYDLTTYYTKNVDYFLTEEKFKGMQLFLQKVAALEPLK